MVRRKATSFGSMNITRVASAGHKNAPILQSLQKKKLTHVIGQAPGLGANFVHGIFKIKLAPCSEIRKEKKMAHFCLMNYFFSQTESSSMYLHSF